MLNKEPRKLKRAVVKEELVALTGKPNLAMVLNQFIYWSERVKDADTFLKEEMTRIRKFTDGSVETEDDIKENLQNGWIYKKAEELIDETMLECSSTTMERICKTLVENGWLKRRRNPKFKWDKTWQYRVDLQLIQKDLHKLGYSLEGYSLFIEKPASSNLQIEDTKLQNEGSEVKSEETDAPKLQNEDSNLQIEDSNLQNEGSNLQIEDTKLQNEGAIPEITSKTSSKTSSKNTYQTIQNEIDSLDIDLEIKKILYANIDRLIDGNIILDSIKSHFDKYSMILPVEIYSSCLEQVLKTSNLANLKNNLDILIKQGLQTVLIQSHPHQDTINKIENSSLDIVIKKVLIRHVDRLVTDCINISLIENHFNAHKDVINVAQYAEVVDFVLQKTNSPIRSITATLNTGVTNKLNNLAILKESSEKTRRSHPVREEKTPHWLEENKKEKDPDIEKMDPEEFEAKKQQMLLALDNIKAYSKA
ncbi:MULTISPECIES: hypothetical protein [Bacillus]|uniref:Uncharacterized protein n=1 Tax=Bacillus glycinifermentans TaxID=1664069 RepID=A0A0T6BI15_9BACI|nr:MULTISPECIES: hypothetical protein [Bacillus]KRT87054.1 hypothetical protein AB447_208795 [Bacillus glycinifermentans]MEC0341892.1 hypothetical protein [Bacillus sonorensis]MEC0457422.1 hypothetical protein [Bacillus sonorensis]MEC0487105.1 hypothetical protein [Bacillus glycinifermentans]MEC0530783.1 hypothetical protein [Bacillus sonorensis]